MAGDAKQRKPENLTEVSLKQDWEIRYWCAELNCSVQQLREAVSAIGENVDRLRAFFGRR